MQSRWQENRITYLVLGLVAGLAISFYWPHEPLKADTASAGEKFAICTVPTIVSQSEAVFVLDSVTGRLVGAAHNQQTGGFTQAFVRNVAADFGVIENAKYLMVPGFVTTRGGAAGGTPANGGIYVAELTSGKVGLYGFLYNNRNTAPQELIPIANFSFRDGK
ncbi:MAG: hypothetical protein DWH91_01705 [Planctomycetota bacterium]|nr:MAG: hypothetical protein DWH91_01705 [Planctomycetota bacterium]